MGKTPEEPKRKWGVWETANEKGVLGVGKTPEEPKKSGGWVNNQPEGVLGVGKTPEESKSKWGGGLGNGQPQGGPRGG